MTEAPTPETLRVSAPLREIQPCETPELPAHCITVSVEIEIDVPRTSGLDCIHVGRRWEYQATGFRLIQAGPLVEPLVRMIDGIMQAVVVEEETCGHVEVSVGSPLLRGEVTRRAGFTEYSDLRHVFSGLCKELAPLHAAAMRTWFPFSGPSAPRFPASGDQSSGGTGEGPARANEPPEAGGPDSNISREDAEAQRAVPGCC